MIIGLSGYAKSGKGEAAKALVERGYRQVAFADKLREILYALNPIVDGYEWIRLQDVIDEYGWEGYKKSPFYKEIRELIQRMGTDCGRNLISDSLWVDLALEDIEDHNIVVADTRFPNEARAIVDRGGIIVRVERPGLEPANGHESETALDNWAWDYLIFNDGTADQLHQEIREVAAIEAVRRIARSARPRLTKNTEWL